MLNKRNFSI